MNPQLLGLILQEAPAVIGLIRELFMKQNPTAPVPTSEEILAHWTALLASSLAKDIDWLARHPTG